MDTTSTRTTHLNLPSLQWHSAATSTSRAVRPATPQKLSRSSSGNMTKSPRRRPCPQTPQIPIQSTICGMQRNKLCTFGHAGANHGMLICFPITILKRIKLCCTHNCPFWEWDLKVPDPPPSGLFGEFYCGGYIYIYIYMKFNVFNT